MGVNKVRQPCCQPSLMQLALEEYYSARSTEYCQFVLLLHMYSVTPGISHVRFTKPPASATKHSHAGVEWPFGRGFPKEPGKKSKKAIGIHLVRGTRYNPGFNGGDQFQLQDY